MVLDHFVDQEGDIDLVAGEYDWDVLADTDQITWSGNVSVANIQSSG